MGTYNDGNEQISGKANNAAGGQPTPVGSGQQVRAFFDSYGKLQVGIGVGDGTAGSDANGQVTNAYVLDNTVGRPLTSAPHLFNGATWDRQRNNIDGTLLASAARTATTSSADMTNYNGKGLHVVLDMTTVGTGSVTIAIEGKDALSGKYYTILAGAAVTTNSTNVYKVYPGLPATANVSANDLIPRTWRITVTANNANSATYSVGYSLIN